MMTIFYLVKALWEHLGKEVDTAQNEVKGASSNKHVTIYLFKLHKN